LYNVTRQKEKEKKERESKLSSKLISQHERFYAIWRAVLMSSTLHAILP